ncbi:MAG: FecR domain-containing protein [Kiloniellales bacterium]
MKKLCGAILLALIVVLGAGAPVVAEGRQYAQVPAEPVARVETVDGQAVAVRADGSRVVLTEGAPIFQGDVLETGPGAVLALIYVDGMTMGLDENTRMVIDQVFYNPASGRGRALFSLVKGVFLSLSGEVAKLSQDAMVIATPTGDIGVRGTNMAASHRIVTRVLLMAGPGQLIFSNNAGITILDRDLASLEAVSPDLPPSPPTVSASRAEALDLIGVSSKAFKVYDRAVSESSTRRAELRESIPGPGTPAGASDVDKTMLGDSLGAPDDTRPAVQPGGDLQGPAGRDLSPTRVLSQPPAAQWLRPAPAGEVKPPPKLEPDTGAIGAPSSAPATKTQKLQQ